MVLRFSSNKNTTWPGPRNNKTWSELSGISLGEINGMEREFLLGMDFRLYVDEATYAIWLSHIKVLARSFLHGVGGVHASSSARTHHPHHGQGYSQLGSTSLLTRTFTIPAAPVVANGSADLSSMHRRSADTTTGEGSAYPSRDRARSTSPGPFTFSSYTSRSRGVSHQQEPHPLTQQTSVPQEVLVRQESHHEEPSPWSDQRYQPVHPATPTVSSMDGMSLTTPISKDIPISGSSTAATRKLTGTFPVCSHYILLMDSTDSCSSGTHSSVKPHAKGCDNCRANRLELRLPMPSAFMQNMNFSYRVRITERAVTRHRPMRRLPRHLYHHSVL